MKFEGPQEQIKRARERLGKSEHEMAAILGMSSPSYYDLEAHKDEAEYVHSIQKLKKIFKILRVTPTFIFRGERAVPPTVSISFRDLAEAIKQYCRKYKFTIDRFENKVGWGGIEDFLKNPDTAWAFCADELRDICKPLKLDWIAILTTEFGEQERREEN